MTSRRNRFAIFVFSLMISANIHAQSCALNTGGNFTDVLPCYRASLESQPLQYKKIGDDTPLPDGVTQRNYALTSQSWSPESLVAPSDWDHEVSLYIPDHALTQRALMIVNNGTNHVAAGGAPLAPSDFTVETLAAIAHATQTVVVSTSDIPNQYLAYQDRNTPLKEDDSVAHSWTLFLDSPMTRQTMPLHVPMAAAVSQAMTLSQRELTDLHIDRFIVAGASKRAWVSWLTAIADPRVDAILPFADDLLNTKAALKHMYKSLGNNWPIAFSPYYKEAIDTRIDTPAFERLMEIEDPLRYLGTQYEKRLSIPKYIVNSSGDDFYAADNSSLYYDRLHGDKILRVIPNANHADILKYTQDSLIPFVNRLQRAQALPAIESTIFSQADRTGLRVFFSEKPETVTLWTADNPLARDFRYACGIRYTALPLTPKLVLTADLPKLASGWQAAFVEAKFSDGLVASSQVYITPNNRYPDKAPLPGTSAACQTLAGRGFRP